MQHRRLLVQLDALDQLRWAGDEAHAQPGRKQLRERVEAQHATVNVHREERWRALCCKLHPVVRVVLEDQELKLPGDLIDRFFALERQAGAGRVAADRDCVEHTRSRLPLRAAIAWLVD